MICPCAGCSSGLAPCTGVWARFTELSPEAQEARNPLPPEHLVEVDGPTHEEVGRGRAAEVQRYVGAFHVDTRACTACNDGRIACGANHRYEHEGSAFRGDPCGTSRQCSTCDGSGARMCERCDGLGMVKADG
jgi:hypothetical protein